MECEKQQQQMQQQQLQQRQLQQRQPLPQQRHHCQPIIKQEAGEEALRARAQGKKPSSVSD